MGQGGRAVRPKGAPGRRSEAVWPATPEPTPPMPFTEWPYGGSEARRDPAEFSRQPLMVALANTQLWAQR